MKDFKNLMKILLAAIVVVFMGVLLLQWIAPGWRSLVPSTPQTWETQSREGRDRQISSLLDDPKVAGVLLKGGEVMIIKGSEGGGGEEVILREPNKGGEVVSLDHWNKP